MSEKLVIRVSGGYMLVDEFLKNYAESESKLQTLTDQVWVANPLSTTGRASPKRKTAASPKGFRAGSPSLGGSLK
jgi:hypothetical protein